MPCRSPSTAAGSNPAPRSRTNASIPTAGHLGVHRHLAGTAVPGGVDDRLAHGRHQRVDARVDAGSRRRPPRRPRTAVVGLDLVGDAVEGRRQGAGSVRGRTDRRSSYSQARSSRSCRRARLRACRGASAWRWIRARVCSTESCRWAAISARSSLRMRSRRSSPSWRTRRATQGPNTQGAAEDGGQHRDADLADRGRARRWWRGRAPMPATSRPAPHEHPEPHHPAAAEGLDRVARQPGRRLPPAGASLVARPGQDQADAVAADRRRPHELVGEERRDPADQQQRPEGDAAHRQRELAAAPGRPAAASRSRVASLGGAGALPGAPQAARPGDEVQRATPTPLASARMQAASRTTIGSTPSHRATPAQTPATMRSSRRRTRPCGRPAIGGRGGEPIGGSIAPSCDGAPSMMASTRQDRLRGRLGDIPDCDGNARTR